MRCSEILRIGSGWLCNRWVSLVCAIGVQIAYRARDNPLVVDDGRTTGSSSVSIEVITDIGASKRRSGS